jgi:hypothetical protein
MKWSGVAFGQFTVDGAEAGRTATRGGESILLAELIEEVDDLPKPLEVQLGEIGPAWSRRESLRLAIVGPAHGDGRVGAIGKT